MSITYLLHLQISQGDTAKMIPTIGQQSKHFEYCIVLTPAIFLVLWNCLSFM